MSSGYDIPPPHPSHSPYEPRRTLTASYERPLNRQRTPSPGPSRRGYDSYVPHRSEYPNVYRPNNYRPEPSSYHPRRSPSPDPRSPESSSYRGSSWRPERRQLPPSPTSRRFEPSDSWRHGHGDRSNRDYSSHPDRHFRPRPSMDLSPDRSPRFERSIGGPDRHAPPYPKRETWSSERRPFFNSYRPHYDDERPPPTRRDYPLSPTNGHARRESQPSWPTDPDFTRIPMKPSLSGGLLASPAPITHTSSDPPWSSPTLMDALKRASLTRSASHSSIASTHVSDRRSPGVASIPQPSATRLPAGLPAKPQAAIDALAKEIRRADAKYGVKPVHNSVISQTPMHAFEPENVLKTVREPANNDPQNVIAESQAQAQASGVEDKSSITSTAIDVNGYTDIDDNPLMPRMEPQSPKPPTINESHLSPVSSPNSVFVESEHSKPGTPPERSPSIRDGDLSALEIPPTTHSPTGSPDPLEQTDVNHTDLLAHTTLPRAEDIPSLSSAQTIREALRITVMTRLLRDHQSPEARINPILMANLAIAPPLEVHPTSTPGSLIDKMCTGLAHDTRLEAASKTRPLLVKYFANRRVVIDEKKNKLREEYTALQDLWLAHCNALNEQQKTLASEQENQPPVRTTRRSMAITDAVRSDFEMEQILASLGNDDATDPNHLSIRNLARVPEMISAVNGKVDIVFDDMNYLVENPAEYYAPDTGITHWTDEEKRIFMEKFGAYPKQFGVIAEFLPNKTAAQCVSYYYLQKKLFIDFRRVISQYAPNKRRRRGMGRKRGNGLLADIAMHDLEVHRGSGSASPSTLMPAPRASRGRRALNAISALKPPPPSRRNPVQLEETPTSTPTPEPETKSRKRRIPSETSTPVPSIPFNPIPLLASTPLRISTPSSSEHYSVPTLPLLQVAPSEASVTVEEEDAQEQDMRPVKRPRRTRKIKSAVMVVDEPLSPPLQTVLLPNEMAESASHGAGRKEKAAPSTVQWSDDDKKRFLSLFSQYGTDFKQIAALMPPKTIGQVTSYYKTHQVSLNTAELRLRTPHLPDNHEPHWSTFPASETKQKIPSPPQSSPATLMTTIKPAPISSAGYDSPRNMYPGSSTPTLPSYNNHTNASGEIISSSWSTPLPTRISQSSIHSGSSNASITQPKVLVSPAPETHHPRRSGSVPEQYSYLSRNPLSSESPQGYASSTGKYPEDHPLRPIPLPSRQSLPIASPPNPPLRTPQDQSMARGERVVRRRLTTSSYSASPSPHAPSATGYGAASPSGHAPNAAIIHSPVLISPHLPLHQSPPPYNSYPLPPLPHGSGPPREHNPQYPQPGPHFQGSSITNWTQSDSPRGQDRHYHQPVSVSDDRRSVSGAECKGDVERRRDTYDFPPGSNDGRYPTGWHPSSTSTTHPNGSTWAPQRWRG